MNPEIKEKWLAALKSGQYKRGEGFLRQKALTDETQTLYCCLGVLCDLHQQITDEGRWEELGEGEVPFYKIHGTSSCSDTVLPFPVTKWAEINGVSGNFVPDDEDREKLEKAVIGTCLTELNDKSEKEDFSDVIPYIEKYF